MFSLKSLFFLQILLLAAWGQTAHRVDDDDTQITYSPLTSWHRNEESNPHDEGGFHMVTDDATATATFSFTGTAIEFYSPLWADSITTALALDGGAPETVDLSDPASTPQDGGPSTQQSAVRWERRDLTNTQHTLVVSVPAGLTFAVVDLLIYYTEDTTSTTTSTSSTSETSQTSTSTTTSRRTTSTEAVDSDGLATVSSSTKTGMTIAIAVVCGLAALLAILGLVYWLRRRAQKQAEARAWTLTNQEPPAPPPMEEIDDGVAAGKGKRFKSVPSRKNLLSASNSDLGSYDSEQAIAAYRSRHSQLVPTGSNGRVSGLRNVVMTGPQPPLPNSGYGNYSHTRTPSDVYSQSSTSPDQRKFTLSPHSEPASNAPSFRT